MSKKVSPSFNTFPSISIITKKFFWPYFSYIWIVNKIIHNVSVLMTLKGNKYLDVGKKLQITGRYDGIWPFTLEKSVVFKFVFEGNKRSLKKLLTYFLCNNIGSDKFFFCYKTSFWRKTWVFFYSIVMLFWKTLCYLRRLSRALKLTSL